MSHSCIWLEAVTSLQTAEPLSPSSSSSGLLNTFSNRYVFTLTAFYTFIRDFVVYLRATKTNLRLTMHLTNLLNWDFLWCLLRIFPVCVVKYNVVCSLDVARRINEGQLLTTSTVFGVQQQNNMNDSWVTVCHSLL